MSDKVDVQVTGMTKEEVAYKMTLHFYPTALGGKWDVGKKDEILDLYSDCLETTSGRRNYASGASLA